jgi:hypothetical protein
MLSSHAIQFYDRITEWCRSGPLLIAVVTVEHDCRVFSEIC